MHEELSSWGTVHSECPHILYSALNTQNHFVCVFRISGEIAIHEMERIVVWGPIEIGPVPGVHSSGNGSLEHLESFLIG